MSGIKFALPVVRSLLLDNLSGLKKIIFKPESTYLFTLVIEIVFIMIKSNQNIQPIYIFDRNFLYTTFADDATFFIKNKESVIELINK